MLAQGMALVRFFSLLFFSGFFRLLFSSFFLGFFSLLSSLHKRKTPHHLFFFSLPTQNSHHQY